MRVAMTTTEVMLHWNSQVFCWDQLGPVWTGNTSMMSNSEELTCCWCGGAVMFVVVQSAVNKNEWAGLKSHGVVLLEAAIS